MVRGRPAKPTHLKLVTGNPGRRPLKRTPKVREKCPAAPKFLSKFAQSEWARVAPRLHKAGVINQLDRAALMAYCTSYGEFRAVDELLAKEAEKDPNDLGLTTKTAKGNTIVNPLVYVRDRARTDMVRFATQLGMTPISRNKVHVDKPDDVDDPADQYLTG